VKIALVLSTAFVTTKPGSPERERRIQQYVNGFQQIAEVAEKHPSFDVFLVDNTVENPDQTDSRLTTAVEKISNLKGKYYFWNNEMGRINKGSGLIAQWSRVLPDLIDKYEYTVHYEPRQHLIDFSFFERMEQRPDTYICSYRDKQKLYGIPMILPRFWTGFFSMKTADLRGYVYDPGRRVLTTKEEYLKLSGRLYYGIRSRTLPKWLARLPRAIETDLPRYVRRRNIPYVKLTALGTLWHEEATDQWVEMVDRVFKDQP